MGQFIIKTNLKSSGVAALHDNINYPPIEKQIIDYIRKTNMFPEIDFRIENRDYVIALGLYNLSFTIKKSKVELNASPDYGKTGYTIGNYHETDFGSKLHYNKDMSKNFIAFLKKIENHNEMYKKANVLVKEYDKLPKDTQETVEKFLNKHFKTKTHKVRFWFNNGDLFRGIDGFSFALHPIDGAPADGAYFNVGQDGKIALESRDSKAENCWRHYDTPKTVEEMQLRIEQTKDIQAKLDSFDGSKSTEIAILLEMVNKGSMIAKSK